MQSPLAPQYCWLVQELMVEPPQLTMAGRHDVDEVHVPLTQVWPPAQALSQAPQLFESVCSLTQVPRHSTSGDVHIGVVHLPLTQVWPVAQALPQAPQLAFSVCSSTHVPLQSVVPVGQVQVPAWHAWPPVHAWAQAPQLALSVCSSTQAPLQAVCPAAQQVTLGRAPSRLVEHPSMSTAQFVRVQVAMSCTQH